MPLVMYRANILVGAKLTMYRVCDIFDIMSTIPDFIQAMPYRERTAWLSLAAIALTFGPYFYLGGNLSPIGRVT